MTIVSAPAGTGPPVKIRTHCPACTVPENFPPAGASPTWFKVAGRARTSARRTASPSIADTSSGGWVVRAARSSANTRPAASPRATTSVETGVNPSKMRWRASVVGIMCRYRTGEACTWLPSARGDVPWIEGRIGDRNDQEANALIPGPQGSSYRGSTKLGYGTDCPRSTYRGRLRAFFCARLAPAQFHGSRPTHDPELPPRHGLPEQAAVSSSEFHQDTCCSIRHPP